MTLPARDPKRDPKRVPRHVCQPPFWLLLLAVSAGLFAVGCDRDAGPVPDIQEEYASGAALTSEPLMPPSPPAAAGTLFESVPPSESGIDFVHPLDTTHPLKRLYAFGYAAGGIAIGDINGDGRPDLFLGGGAADNRLYVRKPDNSLGFLDVTEAAGVSGAGKWATGAALADVDGDGDLDLHICYYDAPNELHINASTAAGIAFEERAAAFGLDHVDASLMPAFADYDNDGDLDLYLMTYGFIREGGFPADAVETGADGVPRVKEAHARYVGVRLVPSGGNYQAELYQVGQKDKLFRNENGERFTNVSDSSGDICQQPGMGLSATWWDCDADGDLDLYVGNDFEEPDHLYENQGAGQFRDVTASRVPHSTWYSMGADTGDLNNDGLVDFFSVDMAATTHVGQKSTMGEMGAKLGLILRHRPLQFMRNALYLNTGTDRFQEGAWLAGLAKSDWSWAPKLADFDNDGRVDVFISNGMSRPFTHADITTRLPKDHRVGRTEWDIFADYPPQRERNLAFVNQGDLRFVPAGAAWGLDHLGMSYAAAYGDLDRDGDLDLVVANLDEPVSLYRNGANDASRVLVSLRGTAGNSHGFGACVTLEVSGAVTAKELVPASGYLSSNDPVLHFGLGGAKVIGKLTVRWPGGGEQQFENLAVNRHYTIREPAKKSAPPAQPEPMFAEVPLARGFRHQETPYNDFARQPLLPNQLSHLGPGLALGDLNGDGRDDLYLGGGAGHPPMLGIHVGEQGYGSLVNAGVDDEPGSEDMGAVFFDAEGDGDLDLFVASGGVECEPGSPALRDRLYLNNGKGALARSAPSALPDLRDSSSCVAAADFDRDGDLDLFVGARSIPGRYPLSPESRLLRNDGGGTFEDAADQVAVGLRQSGMVTGAVWSDADNDGWLDLLVTCEWGPVRIWSNREGQLVDATVDAGLAGQTGWWNGIGAGDVDNDGDIDFVATNFGLNTKYHASTEVPALLFCGDFASDGGVQLVEAEYENDVLFPVRGKSCSTRAMPHLAERFKTFREFALAPLEKIYPSQQLEQAQRFSATTLESVLFLNRGDATFEVRKLPRIAQVSPGFGVAMEDVDADGNLDLYLVHNFWTPQIETGRMDGGLSQLLLGDGTGRFDPVPPRRSGLLVPGDAKALVSTDINRDGRVDFIVAGNASYLQVFENRVANSASSLIDIRPLAQGKPVPGARIEVAFQSGRTAVRETYAGSGYLSQSSEKLIFGRPGGDPPLAIRIRWSDGTVTTHDP